MTAGGATAHVGLRDVVVQWGRIGCIGFGGPPTHISLLRELCVTKRRWMDEEEFEDAIAACNLLPGPASTQLSILCAWAVAGPLGALVGGLAFVVPGLVAILGLAAVFLAASRPPAEAPREARWLPASTPTTRTITLRCVPPDVSPSSSCRLQSAARRSAVAAPHFAEVSAQRLECVAFVIDLGLRADAHAAEDRNRRTPPLQGVLQ